jgi:hypothetical protein
VDQLYAVSKRISDVTSLDTRNAGIIRNLYSFRSQPSRDPVVVKASKCRMRFSRGTKLALDSQMDLHGPALKPASTAFLQLRWLLNFTHPKQATVECARLIFHVQRHGQLHVIDRDKRISQSAVHEKPIRTSKPQPSTEGRLTGPDRSPRRLNQFRGIVTDPILKHSLDVLDVLNFL